MLDGDAVAEPQGSRMASISSSVCIVRPGFVSARSSPIGHSLGSWTSLYSRGSWMSLQGITGTVMVSSPPRPEKRMGASPGSSARK